MGEVPHHFDSEVDPSSAGVLFNVRNGKLNTIVQNSKGDKVEQVGEVAYTYGRDGELIVIDGRYANAEGTDQIELLDPILKKELLPRAARDAQARARLR